MSKRIPFLFLLILLAGASYFYLTPPSKKEVATPSAPESVSESTSASPQATTTKKQQAQIRKTPDQKDSVSFDLDGWKKKNDTPIDLKHWKEIYPSPYRSYFPSESAENVRRWVTNLGPLGVVALPHNRSWVNDSGAVENYPKALTDKDGLLWNAYEVVSIIPGSPAEGKLKKGDLILAMDGTYLKSSTQVYLHEARDGRTNIDIEMHAGMLIDQAEGNGKIDLTVLRLPEPLKNTPVPESRTWTPVQTVAGSDTLDVPLGDADFFRIRPASPDHKKLRIPNGRLSLVNDRGITLTLETTQAGWKSNCLNVPFEVPATGWKLVGDLECKKKDSFVIETAQIPDFSQPLKEHTLTVHLEIDPIGSFGETFDPQCEKAKNEASMLAHRLALQQKENGSWEVKTYAELGFPTAISGLALMSTGDPAYEENIRKAAYYIQKASMHDKWSYSKGLMLTFISEYYLRTKDAQILPFLKLLVKDCRRFILSDYTSGHGYSGPGYGGGGYIGGGGALACGFAVASHTPAMDDSDLELLDRMLERVQEIAPDGKVPYGRTTTKKTTTPAPGQSGSCGTGPYFAASLIRGGAQQFITSANHRYSTAPFGSAEHGHATETLHFFWGSIAVLNTGIEPFEKHMNAYLWQFVTRRTIEGFANKNNTRCEYHNGDGVIGEPYWRTAGYVILLNGYKRNLAITGNPDYREEPRPMPVAYHRDVTELNTMLRNWAIVEAYLGKENLPEGFSEAISSLRAIKRDQNLSSTLRATLQKYAPQVVKALVSQPQNKKQQVPNAQLAEMLMGLCFKVEAVIDFPDLQGKKNKKALKQAMKKVKKEIANGDLSPRTYRISFYPQTNLTASEEGKDFYNTSIDKSFFKPTDITYQIEDTSKKILKKRLSKHYNPKAKSKAKELGANDIGFAQLAPLSKHKLYAKISYKVNGTSISYVTPFTVDTGHPRRGFVPSIVRILLRGTPIEDYSDSYSLGIRLETGQVIGIETHHNPLPYLLAGAQYELLLSDSSVWAHGLFDAKALTPQYRIAKVTKVEGLDQGEQGKITDNNPKTQAKFTEGKHTLIFHLSKPETISHIAVFFPMAKDWWQTDRGEYTLEAKVDGKWIPLRRSKMSVMRPVTSCKTDTIRLTLDIRAQKSPYLNDVIFITGTKEPLSKRPTW